MAAPTFVAISDIASAQNGVAADCTVTLPSHQADDVGLLLAWERNNVQTITCSTVGWSEIAAWEDTNNSDRYILFGRRFTSGSETNPVVDRDGTNADAYGLVAVYRGCITTETPWEVVGTPAFSDTDPLTVPGITTLTAESLVVVASVQGDNLGTGVTVSATNPAAFTSHHVFSGVGSDCGMAFSEAERATAGATGDISVLWNVTLGASDAVSGIAIALKPPGGGGGGAVLSPYYASYYYPKVVAA